MMIDLARQTIDRGGVEVAWPNGDIGHGIERFWVRRPVEMVTLSYSFVLG